MKNITKDQKKIMIKAGIILVVFLVVWLFFYIPLSKRAKSILSETLAIEEEIRMIESLTGGQEIIGETIISLKERLARLMNKFPKGEEEAIKEASLFAKKTKVEIVLLEFSPKKAVFDNQRKPIIVDGREFRKVSFTLELICTYEELLRYFELLKNDLSAFISINRLSMHRIKDFSDKKLKVKVNFDIYLLS